jgi:hypothetical protein
MVGLRVTNKNRVVNKYSGTTLMFEGMINFVSEANIYQGTAYAFLAVIGNIGGLIGAISPVFALIVGFYSENIFKF